MRNDLVFGKRGEELTAMRATSGDAPRPGWMKDRTQLPKKPPTRDGRPWSPAHKERRP